MEGFNLKPCPLCGGRAAATELRQGEAKLNAVIRCQSCGLTLDWDTEYRVGIAADGHRITAIRTGLDPFEAWDRRVGETDNEESKNVNDLYNRTAERLGRVGIKDPTSQITALAQEIEQYRAKICHLEAYIEQLTTSRNRVTYAQREKVYQEAIEVNGSTVQQIVALEELSEAQKEICKLLRSQGSLDHLAEEVADATIVLEQVRLIHGINDQVNKKMDEKVERLRRNLAAARAKKEETG